MRRLIIFMLFTALCISTGTAVTVYQNNYNGETPGAGFPAWNWGDNGTVHTAVYADDGGNIVVSHTGVNDNSAGTAAVNARFGSKWDLAMNGNISADPADYTISFDVRNVSGDLDPINLELFVLTYNPAVGTGTYGYGSGASAYAIADGWVHVEINLADLAVNWWEGQDWDLTNPMWSLEFGGPPYPGISVAAGDIWNQLWFFDNLKITMGSETEPYDPLVTPENDDGSVGTLLLPSQTEAEVTLHFKAGGDPNTLREPPYPVNPDILGHYIYLSNGGATDPNLYLLDYVEQVHDPDPYLTDPNIVYGPITLAEGTLYYWQVEEALDDGTGSPYGPGDPNNTIWGPVWSFITISKTPVILDGPKNDVADTFGNASFSVTTGPAADHYQWFKVGSPDELVAEGEIVPETHTAALNITGAVLDDEGLYYCIVYNGVPGEGGAPSEPSNSARLWLSRLIGYWKFDGDTTDSVGDEVTGAPAHDGSMKTGDPNFVSETGDSAVVGTDALRIYSDGQFLLLPDADYFNFYQDGFTINFWYKAYAPAPPGNVFLSKFDAGTSGWLLRSYDGADSAGDFIIEGSGSVGYGAISDNQWNMLTITYDPTATTVRTYTNGAMINEGIFDLAAQSLVTSPVKIGGEDTWGTDITGDIAIDELRMYSYPITTVEIAQNYLGIAGGDWICNNELYDLQYDFDGNCRIDLADIAMVAATWLDNYRIYPE